MTGFNLRHLGVVILLASLAVATSSCKTKKTNDSYWQSLNELSNKLDLEVNANDNVNLLKTAAKWIGTPYKNNKSKRGVDCSGLVNIIYKEVFGETLEHSAAAMLKNNCKKISKRKLKTGDLVFFKTNGRKEKINHVGVYLKSNRFIHASTSKGVMVSSLDEPYYKKTFVTAGRVKMKKIKKAVKRIT